MAEYTHIGKVVGTEGLFVGANDAEVTVASATGQLYQSGTAVTSSAAELNIMDGVTATTAELNQVDNADRLEKVAKIALAAVDTAGGVFAWQNDEDASILVTGLFLDVTTKTSAACTVDCGTTATSATTLSDTLIDGLDINAATGLFDNITDKGTNGKSRQKLASGKWVTGSVASGASAGLVGFAYIKYIVI